MLAGSRAPAKPSHFINVEYDPIVRNRINSLLDRGDCEAAFEYVGSLQRAEAVAVDKGKVAPSDKKGKDENGKGG